jgi:NAD(P)-dependent dehydrogenase (short-subunit alcohol dehydrogenase family)
MPTALITGGTRGLGNAMATALAARKWRLIIDGRDQTSLDVGFAGDVTDPTHRANLVAAVGHNLDLLINNASELGPSPLESLGQISQEHVSRIFDVNVFAPLALTQALLQQLISSSGVIVNISSDAAVEAYSGWGTYGASKAALDQLSAVLAEENPDLSIYAFDPGDMQTDMHQAAFPGEDISDRPLPETVIPTLVRLIERRPASRRLRAADLRAEVK